jgi:hypothetical protein
MRFARIGLGASISVALIVACGSSNSNSGGDGGDAGDAGITGDDGYVSPPCSMGDGGALCASGMECCMPMFNIGAITGLLGGGGAGGAGGGGLPALPMNSCVPMGTCGGGTVIACNNGTNCSGGQVCCVGTPTPEGGAEAGSEAGAAAGGGLAGLFGGGGGAGAFSTATTCQATCLPGQRQQCASSAECTDGQTCQAPNFGGAGGGLFGGEGGIGGLFGGLLGGMTFTIPMSCMAPPAEGGTDSGIESGTGESGTQTDAEAGAAETGPTPDTGTDTGAGETSSPTEAGE